MLVLGGLNLGVRPTVNAELLVRQDVLLLGQVLVHLRFFGPEIDVLGKDAGAWVLSPQKGRIGVAFAFHLNITIKAPHRAHL
jgi:hypothetical protein